MPEVEYATTVAAPVDRVWEYVEDLHRWCHLMIGYQSLEIIDDRQSIWTLRGDVGILTRVVKIKVDITEWIPRERVRFVITGLTERLDGGGAFLMTSSDAQLADEPAGTVVASAASASTGGGFLRRWRFRIARAMLRRLGRKAAVQTGTPGAAAAPARPEPAGSPAPTGTCRLVFALTVTPLGPMAPMLDLLMAPMLEPAAHDLADGIRSAVES